MERNSTGMYINNRGAMFIMQPGVTLKNLKEAIVNKVQNVAWWLLFKIFDLLFFEKEAEIDFFNDFFNPESIKQDYPDLFLEECLKLDTDISDPTEDKSLGEGDK